MTSDRLAVSPRLIIALHPPPHPREPRKLVGWVPGLRNRVLLDRTHAIALAELSSGRLRRGHAQPDTRDEAAWTAALKGLLRSGLCTEGDPEPGRFPPFDAEVERCDVDAAPASRPTPARLQLAWNFAMRPGPEGFLAFSARCRRYLSLPPDAVAVLVSFVNEAGVDAVLAEAAPHARAFVEWLVSRGVLVAAQADHGERVVPTRLADVKGSCVAEQVRLADEIAGLSALSAAPPRPDARAPVYLVSATTDAEVRSQLPLAIGAILAHARSYEGGALSDAYHFIPELFVTPAALRDAVLEHGPGVVLFSDYAWTLKSHLCISKMLKAASPEFVTVHGGPSVPAHAEELSRFLAQHDHIDVAVRGEGELTTAELLKALASSPGRPAAGLHRLREVAGLTFRDPASETGLTRTADRPRAVDVNIFPSAYLSGSFDGCRKDQLVAAVLETNRGCPYGCTFCDWGSATLQKIRTFDLERVRGEIAWIAAHRIPIIWCADANFGILERDVEIARMVADARRRHGFPRQLLVSYAKNATARLAEIVRILRDADVAAEGVLSMQTTDEATLSIVRRSNIKTRKYDELVDVFRDLKLPVTTDLMTGLPGSTVDSFAGDLQHCIDRAVPARVFHAQVLPNSPMAEPAYREKYRIETDESDNVVSTFSFTRDDLQSMRRLYDAYRLYETSGVLFYLLRYLQWDHGIQAVDFLRRLVAALDADPGAYPALAWVDRYSPWNLNPGGWRPFYEDIVRYLEEQHGIGPSPALDAVLRMQEAVLREPGRELPETVRLSHDVVAWWRDHGAGTSRPPASARLDTYPPVEVVVDDPDGLCRLDLTRQRQYDHHFVRWELQSPLRAADAVALFLDTG
ncbi:B12-binding domain-containing radical SAM protein [Sorangium sp. So ce1389]|uniref:B12-binding domain-containing radical SAM protein n=1 Tax=Sorangium sp. So ce1389 TaxID=3133336 RepID=UPI003F5F32FD